MQYSNIQNHYQLIDYAVGLITRLKQPPVVSRVQDGN